MRLLATLAALVFALAPVRPARAQGPDAAELNALFSAGQAWTGFYRDVEGRRALWERNAERAAVPADLLERARAVPGRWRLLVVALDRCSDSVNTVPWIAALADAAPGLELRIVHPDDGRAVMEAHRTPDGRAATPTLVVLDEEGRDVGAWVERPSPLQRWYLDHPDMDGDERYRRKMEWYDGDAGRSTLEEVVSLLEESGRVAGDGRR